MSLIIFITKFNRKIFLCLLFLKSSYVDVKGNTQKLY
ncbi:hypothetical protein A0H76_3038 [Hepatospora eriocheir]|uniref:Uncharacterized protein n=1 Tax=Hepatospora eriocheir TaxID=1081669 RepID=A0A1X0QGV8_9MICR|nr:hypothetical protein A0H76_3038 [Hepatospora eriocheir]